MPKLNVFVSTPHLYEISDEEFKELKEAIATEDYATVDKFIDGFGQGLALDGAKGEEVIGLYDEDYNFLFSC